MSSLGLFLLTWSYLQGAWIGEKPGLRFRPMLGQDQNGKSPLIWFNRNVEQKNSYWGTELKKFINQNYQSSSGSGGNPPISCSFGQESATEDHSCLLEQSTMLNKACTWEEFEFGYGAGVSKPCVLIQFDKMYNWIPQSYETLEDLVLAEQKDMPIYLVERIRQMIQRDPNDPMLKTIWVSCDGEDPAARENIGNLEYYSAGIVESGDKGKQFPGIPNYFFPYQNQDHYRAPFVFVKFTKLQANVLIRVKCKAWAKNLDQAAESVHFELMAD